MAPDPVGMHAGIPYKTVLYMLEAHCADSSADTYSTLEIAL